MDYHGDKSLNNFGVQSVNGVRGSRINFKGGSILNTLTSVERLAAFLMNIVHCTGVYASSTSCCQLAESVNWLKATQN